MTEISVANLDFTEFSHSAEGMLSSSDKKIFFEEKINKKYYQQITLFRKYTLENGGSCSDIKNKVSKNNSFYGVIDGDFVREDLDRIYQIDFYSIENIVLIYHDTLDSHLENLRRDLKNHYKKEKLIRHRLIQNINCSKSFAFEKGSEINLQFYDYIDNKINNEKTFLKYMDLKKIVCSYMIFLKQDPTISKECKKAAKDYITTCKVITIDELFSKSESKRVQLEL